MNNLLGVVRSKDKVFIAILMITFASILALSIGAVTQATIDPHIHTYTNHIEHIGEGKFTFVSVCSDENCPNPVNVQNILSGITEDSDVYVAPTCCEDGMKRYSFTYEGVTYTLDEKIDKISHKYEGTAVVNDGKVSAVASCSNDGCTKGDIVIETMPEIEPVSVVEATCHSPRRETYTFDYDGESVTIVSTTEEDVAHTLNGVYVTEFQNADGTYKYGTDGLVVVGTPVLLCGQKTSGYYTCEECNKAIVAIISKGDHNYVYNDKETVRPDGNNNGIAYVRCTNDECTDVITITLPKVVEGNEGVTLVEANHLGKYRRLAYYFENSEYGIVVEFEIDIVWDTHEYVYVLDQMKMPGYTSNGTAVVVCKYADEGCTVKKSFVLPKIEIGKNAELVCEATEATPNIVHYYVKSELYGDFDFDITVGNKLDHDYHYTFEHDETGFVMVGKCNQPDCQTPVTIDRELEIDYVDTSTCYSLGQHIWTCVYKNGETYTIVETATELKPHNMSYIADETVKPDFDKIGRANIRCLNDGCTKYETLDLPKLVIDSNAFIVHTDANTGVKTIIYSFKFPSTYNFEPITIYYYVNAHVHNYQYKLEPNNGVFDLVGRCSGWDCDQLEVRIVDVEVSYMNTSTCTQFGESIWIHFADDGASYTFALPSFELGDHSYSYDESELVRPDFDNEGTIVIRCSNQGCSVEPISLTLPKMSTNKNLEIVSTDSETGIMVVRYTFKSEPNNFVFTFEFEQETHVHNYSYELIPSGNTFNFVVSCNGVGCDQPEIIYANVETAYENTSTCTQLGEEIWSYEFEDGNIYTYTRPSINYAEHDISYYNDQTVNPDFDNEGLLVGICANEECTYNPTRVLPKVSVGNTKSVGYDSNTKIRTLKYTYTYGTFVYEFELTMFDDHIHEYTTTLEPYDRKFDLITRCNSLFCDSEMRDSAVDAVLVEDYYSCVEEGYQVWQYEKDGILYECTIIINIYGHFMTMTYDELADTTVIPDFENGGSVLVYCDFCGEQISYVDLPKAQLNVNTFVIEETNEYVKYEYTYVYEGLLIISFDIVVTK